MRFTRCVIRHSCYVSRYYNLEAGQGRFNFCIFGRYFKFLHLIGRFILRLRLIFLILAIVSVTRAQLLEVSDSFMAENRVRKVMVDGTENMDERAVLGRVSIRDGQTFTPAALSEKIQASVLNLYNSEQYDDVTAWIEYVGDGTDVDVIFKIKELPALDTVLFDGCDEISEEDLRLKLRLIPDKVYSKSQLERDRQALLDYFHSEGYLLAEVG